ncbi:VapA/VapB family virulence-associated protein [Lacinutrix sp. 5H-3-7-4]|uniref:VapA/VapB family virulence-associated protein n=1 Tax=Lacinutrix sp. (strain 5H-3-7-4) TaxID=983544 RepID=UPI00020A3A66|nr:VapA/VapB family virulence-associated protein [Lacinutrix sp. 5H-3-7-4]AEH01115.1 virulence-associated family protein [Lacinutrix sp. 5H-3-7-4]
MKTTQEQRNTIIAHDFITKNTGVLDQNKIDNAVKTITAKTQSYPAKGSVASFIFYLKFQVNITGGKSFNGNAGGASTPGGGALIGDVYTSDINRLYSDTVSFQFTATPVYTSIIFFDKSSNALGTFQCGAVSTVAGVGGGSGKW